MLCNKSNMAIYTLDARGLRRERAGRKRAAESGRSKGNLHAVRQSGLSR